MILLLLLLASLLPNTPYSLANQHLLKTISKKYLSQPQRKMQAANEARRNLVSRFRSTKNSIQRAITSGNDKPSSTPISLTLNTPKRNRKDTNDVTLMENVKTLFELPMPPSNERHVDFGENETIEYDKTEPVDTTPTRMQYTRIRLLLMTRDARLNVNR